jgi:multiple sugar transport system substrate-binding protein
LSLWAIDVEGENARELLPSFTQATGLPVDLQWLAWTAAHEKLLTAFAGESLPDVFMLSRDWVAEFTLIGAILPLPVDGAGLLADAWLPHDLAIDGRDHAVPWTMDLSVQYYRRDLLARAGYAAPPTVLGPWRDMLRAVKRVQGDDRFAVLMQLNWPDHLIHMAEQQPDPLLRDQQTRGNFRSPGFRNMLGFYRSLFDEGLAPRVSSIEAADPPGDLARGWTAIYPSGAWPRAELIRRRKLIDREAWATAPMPGVAGAARAIVAGAVLCVARTTPDPARAWALVRHLTAPPTELQLTRIAGTLPSRPSAWASLVRDPAFLPFRQGLERPLPSRRLPEWHRVTGEVQLVAEQLVRGRVSLDEAVVEMDRRANAILAKRRWLLERGRIA